ncbi:MAG: helical backbone metal receptor [Anaerolineae bacterium]
MNDPTYLSGTKRLVPLAPQKIASLVPWVSESLAELALADLVMAVTDDAAFPEGGFPFAERVGPSSAPDIARLLELAPELVLIGPRHRSLQHALQAAGVPVWLVDPRTVREAFNALWDWMNAFERPQMVARVRTMEWMCDWLERLAETRPALTRVLALLDRTGAAAAGASFTHDLLRLCGGDALLGEYTVETLELSERDVTALRPDVILLATGGSDGFTEEDAITLAALDTPAGRAGRVVRVDGTLLTWPGTRMARAFDLLPNLLDLRTQP